MTTFVALLMLLQLGQDWGTSTLLASLLALPWAAKTLVTTHIRHWGHIALQLRIVEMLLFGALVALAFCFVGSEAVMWHVYGLLMAISILCSWHEVAARIHYEHLLRPAVQRLYDGTKLFYSQLVAVVTYGIMLAGVGFLEVFYHNRRDAVTLSWSTAVYVLAGVYLLLVIYNLLVLPSSTRSQYAAIRNGAHHTGAQHEARPAALAHWRKTSTWAAVVCLTLMLLPQAMMFHTRVLFFIAPRVDGGLGATLQWIGLAQGTVGVIAFSVGLMLGRRLLSQGKAVRIMSIMLPLSPLVYWLMAHTQPASLPVLCVATAVAQMLFGCGLNACQPYVRIVSGLRYRTATNYLYIPVIALAMLLPMAVSGWLAQNMDFKTFFAINSILILPALIAAYAGNKTILSINECNK